LQHLRNSQEARTLWIDTLCINQNGNNVERGVEVLRMCDISGKVLGHESLQTPTFRKIVKLLLYSKIEPLNQLGIYAEHFSTF